MLFIFIYSIYCIYTYNNYIHLCPQCSQKEIAGVIGRFDGLKDAVEGSITQYQDLQKNMLAGQKEAADLLDKAKTSQKVNPLLNFPDIQYCLKKKDLTGGYWHLCLYLELVTGPEGNITHFCAWFKVQDQLFARANEADAIKNQSLEIYAINKDSLDNTLEKLRGEERTSFIICFQVMYTNVYGVTELFTNKGEPWGIHFSFSAFRRYFWI